MLGEDSGGEACDADLDAGRSPGNELSQFPLSDPLKTLVHLSWIHFSLHMCIYPW